MISRVAETCFWLGRQVERSENLARLLSVPLRSVTQALRVQLPEKQTPLTLPCEHGSPSLLQVASSPPQCMTKATNRAQRPTVIRREAFIAFVSRGRRVLGGKLDSSSPRRARQSQDTEADNLEERL